MSIRVNLIREGEVRQPGMMNPKVIMRISLFGGGGILALIIVFVLFHVQGVKRALSHSRGRLRKIDPVYQDVRALQDDLRFNRALYAELQGWHNGRYEWHTQLKDIQDVVPPDIQLTRLTVKGGLRMIQPPAWDKKSKPTPARRFKMRLDGRAAGENGNEVVVRFVRTLRSAPAMEPLINSIKMATGLKRSMPRPGQPINWSWPLSEICGASPPRRSRIQAKCAPQALRVETRVKNSPSDVQ